MKAKTKKTSTKSKWITVSKGVQQMPSGNYRARKTVNGTYYQKVFTSKTKAIAYYKSTMTN